MSITPRQLTPEFIRHLKDWQDQGNRSVEIKIDRQFYNGDTETSVWVWDNTVLMGCFISSSKELPSHAQLMQLKKKRLEQEREQLEKEMF